MKHTVSHKYIFTSDHRRQVSCSFDGGYITSEGGVTLLKLIEDQYGLIKQFSQCFTDYRNPLFSEHSVEELLRQRIFGLALGYEDITDHDDLRYDPLLATVVGKSDPTGETRIRERDKGKPLAGKSTLNRLELATPANAQDDRYKKIVYNADAIDRFFEEIIDEILEAYDEFQRTQQPARFFRSFLYRTLDSWSRSRRVVGKAEYLAKGDNPRFIVTSFGEEYDGQWLYEKFYCARGEMENRIKEQQLSLFADRTSSHTMRANQLRLWFASVAYLFFELLRHEGLAQTNMKTAQCETLRLKLLKIGAFVRITTRRVVVSLASGYPYERYFAMAYHNLKNAVPIRV
jgi:hypothetical protein